MTTSLKDVDSAQMVNFLASVGGFNEEYYAYGYAFVQNGEARYVVSEDYHQIRQRHGESIWARQMATPIQQTLMVDSLLSGTKEERLFQLKLKLAKTLYEAYPPAYFAQDQQNLAVNANLAWDLLEEWRQEIHGYFEADDLQLFEEAVRLAYEKSVLDASHCRRLRQWIKEVNQQMDDNNILKNHFHRTFWGFFPLDKGGSQLICNAAEEALYRQKIAVETKGILVSPVFSKTYWYEKSSDLPLQHQRFEKHWQEQAASCQFVARIQAILDLAKVL